MNDSDLMPFGKHDGEKLGDVPASYLLWLGDQPWVERSWPDLFGYILGNFERLEKEAKRE